MHFPIRLRFKVIALASQIYATDSQGNDVFYVKQKLFKFKEAIEIYNNAAKEQLLYTLKADRVLDFSPQLTLRNASGQEVGAIKRHGARSIWKASYDISVHGSPYVHVREASAWVKVLDGLLGEIPIVGLLTGYLFHPEYIVEDSTGRHVATLAKKPAFFEGVFELNDIAISGADEDTQRVVVALLMAVALMERTRG